MRVTRLRAGFSAALMLFGLVLGGLVSAPSASAISADFTSTDFANWDQSTPSPIESFTGNIGSTFTVAFPSLISTCVTAIIKPTFCGVTQMTLESSAGAVTPSNVVISTSGITTFTVVRSGTLTLTPVGINVACGTGCTPLTIVITAVGPKSFVSSDCLVWNSNGGSNEGVSGRIGETFTVTFPNLVVAAGGVGITRSCPNFLISSSTGTVSPASGTIDSQNPLTFTIWGSGTVTLTSNYAPLSVSAVASVALTISVTALPTDVPPPDLLQQVGAPSASACSTFIDTTLNWAGAPSGGWAPSWAQWVNQGKGGAVCSRSLYWLSSGRWGVRP
ncbi:unannotated protein [freshwater metagenome]|uniref:Unannotated protein n=1 Tax=freshwater metagenome TaxID=449393 RepID=A0A6J7GK48_9ZZZZ